MSDKVKIRILLIISLCAFTVLFFQKIGVKETPAVTAVRIVPLDVKNVLSCSGIVKSKEQENIVTDVPVIARKINVKKGSRVKKGDVLAEIDVASTEKLLGITLGSLSGLSIPQGDDYDEIISVLEEYVVEYNTGDFSFDLSEILSNTEIPKVITASIDGVVTDVNIEKNLASTYGKALFCISGSDELTVVSDVNENSIEKIEEGMTVLINGAGFSRRSYRGRVSDISGTAVKKTSLGNQSAFVEVTVDINNADNHIKPGYNARIDILTDDKKNVIIAPYGAVRQNDDGEEYVYIYENGRAYRRSIKTGEEFENGFEVLSGLFDGDVIITQPDKISANGCSISVIPEKEQ